MSANLVVGARQEYKQAAGLCMQVVNVTGGRLLQLLAAAEVLQHGGSSQGAPLQHLFDLSSLSVPLAQLGIQGHPL